MNSVEKPTAGGGRTAWGQRAGLVAILCLVACGWLVYFVITGLVVPASQVATEKGKITGVEKHYASELSKLKAEEKKARQAGEQALASEKTALHVLRQDGPGVLARSFAQSMKLEREATTKLMIVLKANAQIQEASAPAVDRILAGNFELKHTGAGALASSLATNASLITRLADRVGGASLRFTPNQFQEANDQLAVANGNLANAIAAIAHIAANVRGVVSATSSDGQSIVLASVRVTLIPRLISETSLVRILASQRQFLMSEAAELRMDLGKISSWGVYVNDPRTGVCLGSADAHWINSTLADIMVRSDKLKAILSHPSSYLVISGFIPNGKKTRWKATS